MKTQTITKETAAAKLNKFGRIAGTIATICQILFIIALVLSIIGSIACFVLPKNMLTISTTSQAGIHVNLDGLAQLTPQDEAAIQTSILDGNGSLDINGVDAEISDVTVSDNTIHMSTNSISTSFGLTQIRIFVILGILTIITVLINLFFIKKLCKAFASCETPFSEEIISGMRKFAYSLIPWAIASMITEGIVTGLTNFSGDFNFHINIGVIFTIIIIFVLTYIFQYGAVLQQESDETL